MFNLLIAGREDAWDTGSLELERGRVVVEYTVDEISERYRALSEAAVEELKSLPSLFAIEHERAPTKIGFITEVRIVNSGVRFSFEFDPAFPDLPMGSLETLRDDIDLGDWELYRTHWAIKDVPVWDVLLTRGLITQEHINASAKFGRPLSENQQPHRPHGEFNHSQVFIVHGHDELAKMDVAKFIESLGLEPIILHMQASQGLTIIEKIEHYSNVGFGIVLYTPCDVGTKNGNLVFSRRARQNVVFEHGYLIGKLGRSRVSALVKGEIETPNDISGVVYVAMDGQQNWQDEIRVEMRNLGYQV